MSPETLIGTKLGKCVLEQMIGEGTMGTVYLARQEQLQRRVAVKVFSPVPSVEKDIQETFQKHLAQALTVNASLNHTNILSILDLGKQGEHIYVAMPHMAGENLQSLLNRPGPLPLGLIQKYLQQLASALDYAHARGVLHRDIKPENVLSISDDEVLLSDFTLASLTTEKKFVHLRRAAPGMLNYIAPEYVLGRKLDQQADVYSLGALLFHMVTGNPPFQGTTLGEVAKKHVKTPPPSPRALRATLNGSTEEVMLRALAKRPDERYASAGDLASAFLASLDSEHSSPTGKFLDGEIASPLQAEKQSTNALVLLMDLATGETSKMARVASVNGSTVHTPEPQTFASPVVLDEPQETIPVPLAPIVSQIPFSASAEQQLDFPTSSFDHGIAPMIGDETPDAGSSSQQIRNNPREVPPASDFPGRGLRKTGLLGSTLYQTGMTGQLFDREKNHLESGSTLTQETPQSVQEQSSQVGRSFHPVPQHTGLTDELRFSGSTQQPERNNTTGLFPAFSPTDAGENPTGTMRLTESVKIVQVPIVGQPGRFVTGFLPVVPTDPSPTTTVPKHTKRRIFVASLLLVMLVIVAGSGILFWTSHKPVSSPSKARIPTSTGSNPGTSATAQATATLGANIILSDDLSQNIHNWPVNKQGAFSYAFEDGAYHITNGDAKQSAPALLPNEVLKEPFTYSLMMEQIKGDMSSPNNLFGMILCATTQNKVTKFYTFEVLNRAKGQYQFNQYDDSHASKRPWTTLWSKDMGKEFHQGSGSTHKNTVKVVAAGKNFMFLINGKQVGTWKGGSLSSGSVGMLVNLNGSEVAFSNLLLSYT